MRGYTTRIKPTPELIDQLDREEVEATRDLSPETKVFGGPRLFDRACKFILAGLRPENPAATEEERFQKLLERLDLVERLENQDAE